MLPVRFPGVDKPGVTFLLDDVILRSGVLFAYAAFFRNNNPVHFQIWRPTGQGDKTFTLISSMRVDPAVEQGVEQVSVLAFFFLSDPVNLKGLGCFGTFHALFRKMRCDGFFW